MQLDVTTISPVTAVVPTRSCMHIMILLLFYHLVTTTYIAHVSPVDHGPRIWFWILYNNSDYAVASFNTRSALRIIITLIIDEL